MGSNWEAGGLDERFKSVFAEMKSDVHKFILREYKMIFVPAVRQF